MSIFVRPDSPPPRQPSPDITPAPLPYPHHPRRAVSQPKIRVHSPSLPPGLQSRAVQPVRSFDPIMRRASPALSQPSPSRSAPELDSRHRSTRRSSVHVCTVSSSPLPAGPAALDPPTSPKCTLRSQPNSFDSFYLPHIEGLGVSALPQQKPTGTSNPPLEKHKGLGKACLRFFRFRTSPNNRKSRSPPSNAKHGSLSWQA